MTQRNICIPEVLCLSPTSPAPMPTPRPSKIADCQIVSPPPKKKENEINENIHSNTAIILSVKAHTEKLDATKLLDGDSETKVHDEKAYNSIVSTSQLPSQCTGLDSNRIKLLFKKNPSLCLSKWSYHLGWRSTTCDMFTPTNSFTDSKRK